LIKKFYTQIEKEPNNDMKKSKKIIGYILRLFAIRHSAALVLILSAFLASAPAAFCGGLEQLDGLKEARDKMRVIKEKRFREGESGQYSRSRPTGPLDYYDPRDKVRVIKITDGCVEKLKKFPDSKMVKTVCDYLIRSRAGAVGVEMLYDTPSLIDGDMADFLRRTSRVALATEVIIDPNAYYKNWGDLPREFNVTRPYKAFDESAMKKGYVNFDDCGGFANLRCRTFLMKNKEIYLSMPLALMFIKERAEDFDIIKNGGNDENGYYKYGIKFKNFIAPEAFIPQCAYTFAYDKFSDVYENASRFIKSPDPLALPASYRDKIVIIGDGTKNAKTYVLNFTDVKNIDIIANCIVEIYNANAAARFDRKKAETDGSGENR